MRSENMAKVALNAVNLPKFEALNAKSWSPRTMVVKDLRQRSRLPWFCPCAQSFLVFNSGPYAVLADNSICLNCSAIKVVHWIGKSGSGISNMWENFPPTHWSRETAHAKIKKGDIAYQHIDHVEMCCHVISPFLIFAVLVVWCSHCRPYKPY